jgi:hypothetical protein
MEERKKDKERKPGHNAISFEKHLQFGKMSTSVINL